MPTECNQESCNFIPWLDAKLAAVARELSSTDRIALTIIGPQGHLNLTRSDLAC
jgi:hypothetical protein